MPSPDAWQQFLEAGRGGLARPEIEQSWLRSLRSGVDPERLDLDAADYDPEALLVAVGSRVVPGTADLLVGDAASVALVDPQGTLTWCWESDPALRRDLQEAEVEPGHRYVEDGVGTCGVGLSMAVRSASMVVGAEHYKQAWHPYTCATAPIVDPVTRLLLGSVNVCCRAEHTNRFVMAAVVAFAERLRCALREAAAPRQRRLVDAHMAFRSLPGVTVVTLDDQIMISDTGPSVALPDRATLWSAVREAGPTAARLRLSDGRVATLRPVTPDRLDDGCVLLFSTASPADRENPLENAEATIIREVLISCGGNKTAAAARLGLSRGTLYKRLRRYGLDGG